MTDTRRAAGAGTPGASLRPTVSHQQVRGKALAEFMVSAQTQAVIKTYGVEQFGQPLFVPVAGKREEDRGV